MAAAEMRPNPSRSPHHLSTFGSPSGLGLRHLRPGRILSDCHACGRIQEAERRQPPNAAAAAPMRLNVKQSRLGRRKRSAVCSRRLQRCRAHSRAARRQEPLQPRARLSRSFCRLTCPTYRSPYSEAQAATAPAKCGLTRTTPPLAPIRAA
jgi:hypothetical protein